MSEEKTLERALWHIGNVVNSNKWVLPPDFIERITNVIAYFSKEDKA